MQGHTHSYWNTFQRRESERACPKDPLQRDLFLPNIFIAGCCPTQLHLEKVEPFQSQVLCIILLISTAGLCNWLLEISHLKNS